MERTSGYLEGSFLPLREFADLDALQSQSDTWTTELAYRQHQRRVGAESGTRSPWSGGSWRDRQLPLNAYKHLDDNAGTPGDIGHGRAGVASLQEQVEHAGDDVLAGFDPELGAWSRSAGTS